MTLVSSNDMLRVFSGAEAELAKVIAGRPLNKGAHFVCWNHFNPPLAKPFAGHPLRTSLDGLKRAWMPAIIVLSHRNSRPVAFEARRFNSETRPLIEEQPLQTP
jgi:hypothetical protein